MCHSAFVSRLRRGPRFRPSSGQRLLSRPASRRCRLRSSELRCARARQDRHCPCGVPVSKHLRFSLAQACGVNNDVVVKEEAATQEAASEEAVVAEESATEEATIKSAAAEVSAAVEAVAKEAAKEVEKMAKTVSNTPDPVVSSPQHSLLALLALPPVIISLAPIALCRKSPATRACPRRRRWGRAGPRRPAAAPDWAAWTASRPKSAGWARASSTRLRPPTARSRRRRESPPPAALRPWRPSPLARSRARGRLRPRSASTGRGGSRRRRPRSISLPSDGRSGRTCSRGARGSAGARPCAAATTPSLARQRAGASLARQRAAAAALCLARLAPALCLAKLGVVAAAHGLAPALPRAPRLQVRPLLPSLGNEIERGLRLLEPPLPVLALLGLSLPRARDRAKGLGRHGRNAAGGGDSRRRRLLAVGGRSLVDDALAQPADFGLDAVHAAQSGAAAGRRGPALPHRLRRGQARVAGDFLQSAIGAREIITGGRARSARRECCGELTTGSGVLETVLAIFSTSLAASLATASTAADTSAAADLMVASSVADSSATTASSEAAS